MKIGDTVVYLAYAGGVTFKIRGEVVAFERVDWTESGTEAGVRFPNPDGSGHWVQFIDPARLEVVDGEEDKDGPGDGGDVSPNGRIG